MRCIITIRASKGIEGWVKEFLTAEIRYAILIPDKSNRRLGDLPSQIDHPHMLHPIKQSGVAGGKRTGLILLIVVVVVIGVTQDQRKMLGKVGGERNVPGIPDVITIGTQWKSHDSTSGQEFGFLGQHKSIGDIDLVTLGERMAQLRGCLMHLIVIPSRT